MKTKFLLSSFILMVSASCSTHKVVEKDTEIHTIKVDTSMVDSLCKQYSTDFTKYISETDITWEITEWSQPDSLGNQYKVRTSKMVAKSKTTEEKTNETKVETDVKKKTHSTIRTDVKEKVKSESSTKVGSGICGFFKYVLGCGLFVILIYIYLRRKEFFHRGIV